ncbi:uncharacterized protein DUF3775 [Thiogranum longum]|uniref:Uncharacterized protein DUF3775 n=1 Tax=Thiogranum longum TaxID=1537524 RepID=A0A4R1HB85_9GAMM|nr:DUF3775 domain-containing protein [Thiogranum longum]TCK18638.1 uncharacterized protein DUF3775 [Thiogranum longum]
MLNLNPETVCFLISRTRVFHSKEAVALPDEPDSPTDDWALQVLADHSGDSVFQEFKATVDDLEPDQQQALVALMWLGRNDFSADEWVAALQEARQNWDENTAEYLIAHPLLADYLLEGLHLLGYSCDE